MSFIPKIKCRNCGTVYSAIHTRCPKCGTRHVQQNRRTPQGTPGTVKGTEAKKRANDGVRWQVIIGYVLVVAIIAAVVTLVSVSLNNTPEQAAQTTTEATAVPSSSLPASPAVTPTPTSTPTPTPTPKTDITSLTITYFGDEITEFSMNVGDEPIELGAEIYPTDATSKVTWKSSDESVITLTVDESGVCSVEAVGSGNAQITLSSGDLSATCTVIVW